MTALKPALCALALCLGLPIMAGAQSGEIFIPGDTAVEPIQRAPQPQSALAACLAQPDAANCAGVQVGDGDGTTFESTAAVSFEVFSFDLGGGKVTKVEKPPVQPVDYQAPEPPKQAKVVLPSVAITIEFDYNSAGIRADQMGKITSLIKAMQDPALAGSSYAVIGHTDAKGSYAYNCDLSRRRAAEVTHALQANYVVVPLYPLGFGESLLKNTYDPHAGENRRVTFMRLPDNPGELLQTGVAVCG